MQTLAAFGYVVYDRGAWRVASRLERDAVDYIARNTDGSPRTLGGEEMLWDLQKSVKFYENGNSSPMVANVDLIVPLRHKIEHRFLPPLDAKIAGHCQSFLMNFETVLVSEFTSSVIPN